MTRSTVDAVLLLLRLPLNAVRLLLATPSAHWVALLAGGLVVAAWIGVVARGPAPRLRLLDRLTCVCGALILLWFLRGGNVDWAQTQDWKNAFTYYSALHEAASGPRLPYHLRTAIHGTERYFANLEAPLSPAAVLMPWVGIGPFFATHVALYVLAGAIGLLVLKRELALASYAWTLFAAAFYFNGHITAHLANGHTGWIGYFLLPWFFVALVRLAKNDCSFETAAIWAATLGTMILSGSWHVFVWCWLFSAAMCCWSARRLSFFLRASAIVALLGAVRLVPGIVTFGTGDNLFAGGFDSATTALLAMTTSPAAMSGTLEPHEVDTFVGLAGTILVLLGAVTWRHPSAGMARILLVPSAVLAVLSLSDNFGQTLFHLPGLVSQRVATRFLIVPVLAMMLMGCVRLDRWLARVRHPSWRGTPALLLGILLVIELSVHLAGWRPAGAPAAPETLSVLKISVDDVPYVRAVVIGLWTTIGASLVLVAVAVRRQSLRRSSVTGGGEALPEP